MPADFRHFYYPNLSCIYILALCSDYAIYYSALNQVLGVINDWSLDAGDDDVNDIFMREVKWPSGEIQLVLDRSVHNWVIVCQVWDTERHKIQFVLKSQFFDKLFLTLKVHFRIQIQDFLLLDSILFSLKTVSLTINFSKAFSSTLKRYYWHNGC